MKTICENENKNLYINELIENGYAYIVKAQDKFLSGWGYAENKKHVHLIACRTYDELQAILRDLYKDKSMSYVNWCYISNTKTINNYTRNKSYTIRNDWTRAFESNEAKRLYMEGE